MLRYLERAESTLEQGTGEARAACPGPLRKGARSDARDTGSVSTFNAEGQPSLAGQLVSQDG